MSINNSDIALNRAARKRKQQELRERKKQQGKNYPPTQTLPNRKCSSKTPEEEQQMIQLTIEEKIKVYGRLLPGLLKKLGKIPDPRSPKKVRHKITVLMIYGIFMFVFQMTSRRKTNQGMTGPQLLENLRGIYPELEDMPHQDTLCRLLEKIEVEQIKKTYVGLLKKLIRNKMFQDLLYNKRYLVAVDGTQKYTMKEQWDEKYLRRKIKGSGGEYQYYAYVLEAVLVFSNGMVLPLASEFLENSKELEAIEKYEDWKQDCEIKAFHRLTKQLKKHFPKLPMTLLLDGLYANGPVLEACRRNKWQFMIVFKDKSLPSVWKDVNGLLSLDASRDFTHVQIWKGRDQHFRWVNDIEYNYGLNDSKVQTVHVVICEERWEEVNKEGQIEMQASRYAWISSTPINQKNVHERCNLYARNRWLHENNILKEKHQGYQYEHIFSYDWDAMKGYHYLMHIARLVNEMALHMESLHDHVKEVGIQGFITKIYRVMSERSLDTDRIRNLIKSKYQLRLVCG
ncbi:transposase family protein [Aquibacillus sp. 3ASR75-11]|uniref:Transposase family protein n=1 Tax=Terrihalobacillus insolitus TaxID=2950438 RepID=A0A9X3WT42_9BACI|nr:transposase family protein [Terrihalobacillus insolitus]MDC3415277.1 transposase family protein [Terrihalobacillus insolitus]MDC3424158.1 transposase family protein [Terrihalobacillus insolitus]